MDKKKEVGYEEALHELEALLVKVESDDVSIDELSEMVQRSVELLKICKNQLRGIEEKIDGSFQSLDE